MSNLNEDTPKLFSDLINYYLASTFFTILESVAFITLISNGYLVYTLILPILVVIFEFYGNRYLNKRYTVTYAEVKKLVLFGCVKYGVIASLICAMILTNHALVVGSCIIILIMLYVIDAIHLDRMLKIVLKEPEK